MADPLPSRRRGWFQRWRRDRSQSYLSPSEFEAAFDLEFLRSERGGHALALVVFAPRTDDDGHVDPLVATISERKRLYDTVGSLGARRIAVLLPYTGNAGGWSFAADVMSRLGELARNLSVTVSTNEGGPGGLTSGRPAASEPAGTPSRRAPEPARAPSQEAAASVAGVPAPVAEIWSHFERPPSVAKRSLDVIGSGAALFVLMPAFVVIGAAIKLTSPGPVFFRQQRAGQLGRPFTLLKFRSMYVDAEARKRDLMHLNEMDGPAFKIKNDPRVTPIGRWLRRLSLDELPQFYNVFVGDMSLVGPRPPTLDELPGYATWQRRRLTRRGGLTCIWQTSGRNQVAFQEWMRMDMRYLRRATLWTDIGLILKTVWTVATGRGAS